MRINRAGRETSRVQGEADRKCGPGQRQVGKKTEEQKKNHGFMACGNRYTSPSSDLICRETERICLYYIILDIARPCLYAFVFLYFYEYLKP